MLPVRRRFVLTGTLAMPWVALSASPVSVPRSLEARFTEVLEWMRFPQDGSELALMSFEETRPDQDHILLTADLRLIWPPGVRHRRFRASASDPEAALAQLLRQTLTEFDAALADGTVI